MILLCLADTRVEFAAEVNKYCRDGKVRLGRSLSFLSLKVCFSRHSFSFVTGTRSPPYFDNELLIRHYSSKSGIFRQAGSVRL